MANRTYPESTELLQLRTRLRLLKQLVTHINSGSAVTEIVDWALLEAHRILPDCRLSYAVLLPDNKVKVLNSMAPPDMPSIEGLEIALPEANRLQSILREVGYLAIPDAATDVRLAFMREALSERRSGALLLKAVTHPNGELAFLCATCRCPRAWTSFEVELLSDMADYLAIAIRESQMLREQREATEKLQAAQRMEAVGRLVGGVAHDFNNILTGMMIYTGLLASALGKEHPLLRHVKEIQTAGERGASLVAQLLSLSRKHVLETQLANINSVVADMQEMLKRLVGEEVVIESHLDPHLPASRLDENQLRQSILNLALNARHAMKQGGRLLFTTQHVTADDNLLRNTPGLSPGDYAVLQVTDTGEGMSPEVLQHCFEPFFTTKAPGEGTGLGLAAVFGSVQQHGGTVTVHSAVNEGTTFNLYFPVDSPEIKPLAVHAPVAARHTILLVEDEAMLRLPLQERLEQEGYLVLSAADPQEGLDLSASHLGSIDLLITDLVMPIMSGQQMAEKIEQQRPEMRVLFMSGYTDDPRARRLIAHGANFLRKPFDAARFTNKVRELLAQGSLPEFQQPGVQKNTSILGKET
jgi:signal transduction histidine kinase/FixJ family two-component response regulator